MTLQEAAKAIEEIVKRGNSAEVKGISPKDGGGYIVYEVKKKIIVK